MAYQEEMMNPAGREEQLRHQAFAVDDMLRQLKQATMNQPDSSRGRPLRGNKRNRRGDHRNTNQPNPRTRQSSSRSRWDYYTDEGPTLRSPSTYRTSTYRMPLERHPSRNEAKPYDDQPMYRTSQVYRTPPSCNNWNSYDDDHHDTLEYLVQCLVDFPNFSASLLQLMESKNLKPSTVRQIVLSKQQIFFLANEVVTLQPKIVVCKAFLESEGCLDRSQCKNFHICPKYITGSCSGEDCFLGHSWLTNHNRSLLECFHIEKLPAEKLQMLFRSLGSDTVKPESLDVCSEYNENVCHVGECQALHICLGFVLGGMKCKVQDCNLNHDILSKSCTRLLDVHGFSTNEAPRDVTLAILAANPSIKSKEKSRNKGPQNIDTKDDSSKTRNKASKDFDEEDAETVKGNIVDTSSSDDSEVSSDDVNNSISDSSDSEKDSDPVAIENEIPRKMNNSKSRDKRKEKISLNKLSESNDSDSASDIAIHTADGKEIPPKKSKSQINDKRKQNEVELIKKVKDHFLSSSVDEENVKELPPKTDHKRTLWSHYIQGNVPLDEICYDSVENLCKYEATGCKRLHATQHFHWQVRESGKNWLNLRLPQMMCLERAFCNVAEDGVDLPRLDPSTIENSVSGLLIVMGRDTWHADFKTMSLTNSGDTKKLQIRRLCSNPPTGQVVKAALYLWYFLDKNNKWVKYGNVDTVGETTLVSSVTSDDIEKNYLANPSSLLSFQNSKFTYILDFKTMTQTNQNTNVSREVRRRPEIHLEEEEDEKSEAEKKDSDLPETWDAMQDGERLTRVPLLPSSTEYQTLINLLAGRISSSNVTQIERIQNPFLWRALQNKIKEMTTIYGDETQVNVRQLFHGTRHDVVSNICGENFDWRLHGSSSGQMYGHGTYFSTDAAYSYNYSPADPAGKRFMFIARVAVGSVTVGNSSMVRPPINPVTSAPYDSTVNNASNFSIIVKFDKQEYYPEYLLTLT